MTPVTPQEGAEATPTSPPATAASTPTPRMVKITVSSQAARSDTTVTIVDAAPHPTLAVDEGPPSELDGAISADAEPIIFTQIGIDQKCGHGDIVAADGHALRSTPRLVAGNANFLDLLPEGARVDLIDCRLWADTESINWLAVRTADKKLGWMSVQADKFYVTLYPMVMQPPRSLTGLPAGSTLAYVPPSNCESGPISGEATATSIGVDLIPVVGDLKGLNEAATGCDMVTGESLGNWRWLGLLGIVGLSEVSLLRHGGKVADGTRAASGLEGSLRYGDEAAAFAGKNVDTAADLARGATKLDEAADAATDAMRASDGAAALSDEARLALAKFEQPCSFSAETPVHTPTGLTQIDQIRPGDRVLGYDAANGRVDFFPVLASFSHLDPVVLHLTIGDDRLVTTPEHPFWSQDGWTPAGKLESGDRVLTASGETAPVAATRAVLRSQRMYNLTVAVAHTYFVGEAGWLVHNACGKNLRANMIRSGDAPDWPAEIEWRAHHIIPKREEGHSFVQRAVAGGWEFDGPNNGIPLPYSEEAAARLGLPAHRGPHGNYTADVRRQLDGLEDEAADAAANGTPWSNEYAASRMDELVQELRNGMPLRSPGNRLN